MLSGGAHAGKRSHGSTAQHSAHRESHKYVYGATKEYENRYKQDAAALKAARADRDRLQAVPGGIFCACLCTKYW